MEDVLVKYIQKVELKNPVMIVGLPGVGNVGKIAVDYIKDELKAVKFAEIYSKYFPPQVLIDSKSVIRLVNNELHYIKGNNDFDLILLTGDYQGLSSEGQYELSDRILKIAKEHKVKMIYTLAGYAKGYTNGKPLVWGAVNNKDLIKILKKYNISHEREEIGGSLVGASGLLLGIGIQYGIDAICLMGETSGYFIDPKSAESLVKAIAKILNIKITYNNMHKKAHEIERLTQKFQDMQQNPPEEKGKDENLNYFG